MPLAAIAPRWGRGAYDALWIESRPYQLDGLLKWEHNLTKRPDGANDDCPLRQAVECMLTHLEPGTLVEVQYRLCEQLPTLLGPAPHLELHPVPQLSPPSDTEAALPSPRLAKTLRPDQLEALQFVLASELQPKPLLCRFHASMSMPSLLPLGVGCQVHLAPTFCPTIHLGVDDRYWFQRLQKEQMLRMLSTSGAVGHVVVSEQGAHLDRLTVSWEGLRDFVIARVALEVTPCPQHGRFVIGRPVRLLEDDAGSLIARDDVGVLTGLPGDAQARVCFPQCHTWEGPRSTLAVTQEPLLSFVELRLTVRYELRGSICAQAMGWGKTPLMAALLESARGGGGDDDDRSPASLLLVPPKLFRQWKTELCAWLGLASEAGGWLRRPGGGGAPLAVWAPVDMAVFKAVAAEDAAKADAVLLPLSLFASKLWPKDHEPWPAQLLDVLGRPWRRLVVDEAHELSGLEPQVQRRVLRAARLSGAAHLLSATPQQGGGSRGTACLALLFKASLAAWHGPRFGGDAQAPVTAQAAAFLGLVARTQPSPFRLPVEERVVPVRLSQAEQVLYANAVQHHRANVRQLLELCCCFLSESSSSARKEIGVLLQRKRRELEARKAVAQARAALLLLMAGALQETARLASRRQALRCRQADERQDWEEGRRLVDELYRGPLAGLDGVRLAKLPRVQHLQGLKTTRLLLGEEPPAEAAARAAKLSAELTLLHQGLLPAAELKLCFNEQLDQHLAGDFVGLGALSRQLQFLDTSLRELAAGAATCPICLDLLHNGEASCLTGCGHAFHAACMEEVSKSRGGCPTCRQRVPQLWAVPSSAPADPWLKYGTKLHVMIRQLQDIMRDYPGERLLLFVQFRNMREKLEQAFREFSVPFLTLAGSARTQGAAITRWQCGEDPDDFLMMLSCEEHSSGITLTRARPARRARGGGEGVGRASRNRKASSAPMWFPWCLLL
jgi:hypothetical protein